MHDERNHLLAQVPLTVSPFVTLPKAPTLPHNYTSLPSTLPPSSISASAADDGQPPAYVTSSSGFAAHPSAIIAQNRALLEQLAKSARDAEHAVTRWEAGIRERELAEKRRKAPGWLDREEKILEPERAAQATGGGEGGARGAEEQRDRPPEERDLLSDDVGVVGQGDREVSDLGAQMDMAFGRDQMG